MKYFGMMMLQAAAVFACSPIMCNEGCNVTRDGFVITHFDMDYNCTKADEVHTYGGGGLCGLPTFENTTAMCRIESTTSVMCLGVGQCSVVVSVNSSKDVCVCPEDPDMDNNKTTPTPASPTPSAGATVLNSNVATVGVLLLHVMILFLHVF